MYRICVWMRAFTRVTGPLFVALCTTSHIANAEAPRIGLYYLGDLVLSDSDIVRYCWSSHYMQLTPEAAQRLPKSVGVHGRPFVLMVDGVKCYSGAFWTHLSSLATVQPVIMVDTLEEFPSTAVNSTPRVTFRSSWGIHTPRLNYQLTQRM